MKQDDDDWDGDSHDDDGDDDGDNYSARLRLQIVRATCHRHAVARYIHRAGKGL